MQGRKQLAEEKRRRKKKKKQKAAFSALLRSFTRRRLLLLRIVFFCLVDDLPRLDAGWVVGAGGEELRRGHHSVASCTPRRSTGARTRAELVSGA